MATVVHDAGVTLAREGRLVEAEELFRTAVRWAPEWPEARRSLGLAVEDLGREGLPVADGGKLAPWGCEVKALALAAVLFGMTAFGMTPYFSDQFVN